MNLNLLQIFTRIYLYELSQQLGRPAKLLDIPDDTIDGWAELGFDVVWMLGIWQTGEHGRRVSRSQTAWQEGFRHSLPDLTEDDISGSPFAITAYKINSEFGDEIDLQTFRDRLRQRGLKLLLDFVPNHTAIDHPWVFEHPEYYVQGKQLDLIDQPLNFFSVDTIAGPKILAYGRDPYFTGWPDTAQLNYHCPKVRQKMRDELASIAEQCDGVRCDMAMLVSPDIFFRTWGVRATLENTQTKSQKEIKPTKITLGGADLLSTTFVPPVISTVDEAVLKPVPEIGNPPDDSFWPMAIQHVRKIFPQFIFIAEVYWNMEDAMHQQGFDLAYDKRLYDRLLSRQVVDVRRHLVAGIEYQRKLVRFLENHDERRAAESFGPNVQQAAAVITYLTPGMRFFYEGQFEGRKVHASVHHGRRQVESIDEEVRNFYHRVMKVCRRVEVRRGDWQLCDCRPAWEGNHSHQSMIALQWTLEDSILLIVVNYAAEQSQCRVPVMQAPWAGHEIELNDLMHDTTYLRSGDEMTGIGLYVDLPAWGYHVFTCAIVK